jgi:hypothetical protein
VNNLVQLGGTIQVGRFVNQNETTTKQKQKMFFQSLFDHPYSLLPPAAPGSDIFGD